ISVSPAPAGIAKLVPSSGSITKSTKRYFVVERAGSHEGVFLARVIPKFLSDQQVGMSLAPLAPLSVPTFTYSADLSETALQLRRQKVGKTFADNRGVSAALRTYLEEAFY